MVYIHKYIHLYLILLSKIQGNDQILHRKRGIEILKQFYEIHIILYIYICIYIYIYICILIYIYMYEYPYINILLKYIHNTVLIGDLIICLHRHIYTCTYTYTCNCTYMYTNLNQRIFI
jgi:hypothetical protein